MDTHRLAGLGFLSMAAMEAGVVALNLGGLGTPGYAFAAALAATAALLSALALRHGWEDHAPLLAWSTMASAAVVTLRSVTAEAGRPLHAATPLAILSPLGAILVALAAWSLWRAAHDPGGFRALRRMALGAALVAVAEIGFAALATVHGLPGVGALLMLGAAGSAATAWAASQAARKAPEPRRPAPPTVSKGAARPSATHK